MSELDKKEEGIFLKHIECINSDCGSSDGLALYAKKEQNIVDGFCWVCSTYFSPKQLPEYQEIDFDAPVEFMVDQEELDKILEFDCRGWRSRRIKKQTAEFYGVRSRMAKDGEPAHQYYPMTKDGELVGFKHRVVETKEFYSIGNVKTQGEFFGQSLFQPGGKYLVITGGEVDAMSAFQALNANSKYITPVVSASCGERSTAAQLKANYEWVRSFNRVIFMLDNDKAGEEATVEAVKLLKPGQAYVAKLNLKDPNEYLQAGKEVELKQAFWNADRYSPADIVGSSQTLDAMKQKAMWKKVPLPPFAAQLEQMLNGGPALGEITNLIAASSVGKTTITNHFMYYWIFNSPYKVGVISLESDVGELVENLMSIHLGVKLANMPDEQKLEYYNTDEVYEAHKELTQTDEGDDRFIILDHQGDVQDDDLKRKVEYMINVCDCKLIILDPLTLALSGGNNDDVDEFMSWLLRTVKREQISHVNVVHVRKNTVGSRANSRGAEISEEDTKGSGSIIQIGMTNILLMRDKENEDPIIRNTTKVVMPKCRRTGNTGPAGYWYYDNKTSLLHASTGQDNADYTEEEEEFNELGVFEEEEESEDSIENIDPDKLGY